MDWLTTATESQWQKEGLIATGEDFYSEPEQSLLLWWLLSFYRILVSSLYQARDACETPWVWEGTRGGAGCLVNMRPSELLTQK